jgi:hypothetical protein
MGRCVSFLLVGDQPWAKEMVASAKDVLGLPIIQMSDDETPEVPGVTHVVRIKREIPLMPYRLMHLASFGHDEMLILDTDIIVKKPVDDVWDRKFDVALCQRKDKFCFDTVTGKNVANMMPFNTGVMFSRSNTFWAEAAIWLCDQPDYHDWYGDQMAVAEVCRGGKHHVLLLPGEEFNWSPLTESDTSGARIWHYKGKFRKAWMSSRSSVDTIPERPPPTTYSANQSSGHQASP